MRTTKKIVSVILAACMLASTSAISGFAATVDDDSTVSTTTPYSTACEALDKQYAYDGNDLGATYSPEKTVFKVWSPTATEVKLNLYATGSDDEPNAANLGSYDLEKVMDGEDWNGVWTVTVNDDLKNVYYTYTITAVPTTGGDAVTNETQDIYSVATGVNGNRSMVCDLDSTDPEGWENDSHVLLDNVTDSSVWELHIKDFSYDEASGVSEENRGKYLAFTEEGTTLNGEGNISTCIDYLKELGITTVQLNPFYDFQSVNEAGEDSQFNWGYDPQNYNVPEGSYSSNPYDGNVRITECKQMIQALHNAGISVVMDVVYNHTYSTDSCFQNTVPNYYYRMTKAGEFSNGSGCGNECATERAMYREFLVNSCRYWVDEYHVDGFRFDLMGLMDVEAMNAIRANLDEVDTRITMWGEGWTGGTSVHPTYTYTGAKFYAATQANAAKVSDRIAFFNDAIRDTIKGSVFDTTAGAFIQGNKDTSYTKGIIVGVQANTTEKNGWLASAPSQTVTYDACHDNATLYDRIINSTSLAGYGERNDDAIKMNKLAGSILYTSQGVTFTLAGEEMCRSKDGDENSYRSAATLNMIKWQNIVDNADVVSYYKGLNQIKAAFSPLTCDDNTYKDSYVFTNSTSEYTSTISFTIANDTEGEWSKMAVLYNSSNKDAKVSLKDKTVTNWVIIANGESAGLENLGEVTGSTFTVPARSAIIAVEKSSFEAAGLDANMGKVKVNYVYEKDGTALADSVILQGTIGTGYQTTSSTSVPNTYVFTTVEGETTGTYSDDVKEVTYYYTDYVPESITLADMNDDGVVDIQDVTIMQKGLASLIELTDEQLAKFDVNYDDEKDISDCTMIQKYLAGMPVSSGSVTVNHYYTDANGNLAKLTDTTVISGRAGDDFTTSDFKVIGYGVDETKYPEKTSGKIPYGSATVNYYYTTSSLDINLHFKHSGSLTWNPYIWIWGSDLEGKDSLNYTSSGTWPGDKLTDEDGDGWYDFSCTYKGAGTYNVIISNNQATQTVDYKGFVDNEMWVVIDDTKLSSGSYLTFYTDNPETNPNAPIAAQVTLG
jgi:type I pullulanase